MFPRLVLTALLSMSFSASVLAAQPVRVILVGDSTMATRSGYGDALCQRFTPDTTCINVARGGRSSGSFRAEGRWDQVRALLGRPGPHSATYVLIQFGHNDQPGKPGRSTDLVREFPVNMARYAAEVKALGGIPVLVTPLTRRSFKGRWLGDDLAPWSAAIRRVAAEGKTALLDLNALSAAAVQPLGQDGADTLQQEDKPDRTHLGRKGALLFSGIVAAQLVRLFPALAPSLRPDGALPFTTPHRQSAPADGWAAQEGGTVGGGAASSDQTYTVTSREELLAAIGGGAGSRIIQVAGIIDMAGGTPFASSRDQDARSTIRLHSNTTLVGIGPHSGFINASVSVAGASQVIVRNLHFRNPCDVSPVWDPKDGAKGNWNSLYDAVTVSASRHVWIDHNSFTDAPTTDDTLPFENGMRKQCHDGALDIGKGSDFVTVSNNHFALHDKTILVGSGDGATGDAGHLRVTFSNNFFEHVRSRAPRVRFGRVHLFNNYYLGHAKHPQYPHEYSVGVGKQAQILSFANVFDIAGARSCADPVHHFDKAASFIDSGSLLNGQPLKGCLTAPTQPWTIPYAWSALPGHAVKPHVLANAGAGKPLVPIPATSPAIGEHGVPPDTLLRIRFAAMPAAPVKIFRKSDGALVDTILPGRHELSIGPARDGMVRKVMHESIRKRGNDIVIQPRSGALAYGTEYYALMDGTRTWSFRTAKAAPVGTTLTVDDDGPAHFRTVQGALDHAMRAMAQDTPMKVEIANGRYEELLYLRLKDKVTLQGQSRDGVVIHAANNNALNPGTGAGQLADTSARSGGRSLLLAEASDLLVLDTLTLHNTALRSLGEGAQAETLYFNNDSGRMVARNATFLSEQDTVQLKGYAWFYRTLVAGNVDFIWGANRAALFEESEIRTVGDSSQRGSGGWLVQARTVTPQDMGFVFLNSRLTHGPGPGPNADPVAPGATYLARSPGRATSWDNISFINCAMDVHIAPEGWARDGLNHQPPPNPATASATSGWREYGSRDLAGQPLDLSRRSGGYILSAAEVARHYPDRAAIFAAFDGGKGWNPQAD